MLFFPGAIAKAIIKSQVYHAVPGAEGWWRRADTLNKGDTVLVLSTGQMQSQPYVLVMTSECIGWVMTSRLKAIELDGVLLDPNE